MLDEEDGNGPESLLNQCLLYIVRHLSTICFINSNYYELHPGHILPREICEKLIYVYNQNVGEVDDKFVNLFRNSDVTNLKRVRLINSDISDQGLEVLLKHNLIELDLEKCTRITNKSLAVLNEHGNNLVNLTVSLGVDLLPYHVSFDINNQSYDPVLKTPNLKKLAIRHYGGQKEHIFHAIVKPLAHLIHLDLSSCVEIEDLSFLICLRNLAYLVLHNVKKVQEGLPYICALKSLRHLDVSQTSDKIRTFSNENKTLASIIKNLPNLVSLDISGTNLAGTGVAESGNKDTNGKMSDIPGLSARMSNKLEFLGLYGTQHAACRRHDIPAKMIAGDANEDQIIVSAKAYIDRPEVLQRVLNDLYHSFRYDHVNNMRGALDVVLCAMDRHLSEKHIQISGSATLFYIVKSKDIPPFLASTKRSVIRTLLNGMNAHKDDDTMMRNGCLTLCQFKIPQDVLFEYERLVLMLLHIVSDMEQEGFVQRIGIYLLNSLACQVDNHQKQLLGDLGAIHKMLMLIEDRVNRDVCDDVLEVAWSTMWNVTDETPVNCQRFLDNNGMKYFLQCLDMFNGKDELMRNMMGLLGNVAEVQCLRKRLMVRKYIETFQNLVNSNRDGIEVSYNAVGVLSHLASDGPEAWDPSCPDRDSVLLTMKTAIKMWDLATERNINYRSFEPILQLARVKHTPECQHWAIWALANLTGVYPDKYCSLVEAEGGVEILNDIVTDDSPYEDIKQLAQRVLQQCTRFKHPESAPPQYQLDG